MHTNSKGNSKLYSQTISHNKYAKIQIIFVLFHKTHYFFFPHVTNHNDLTTRFIIFKPLITQ